jgi:hypothetical protein
MVSAEATANASATECHTQRRMNRRFDLQRLSQHFDMMHPYPEVPEMAPGSGEW